MRIGKNLQAIIQVGAEAALLHHLLQILIGGGDDADVHANGPGAAEPLELLFLQNSQKLRLQLQRHVANFIEKQSARVRPLEASDRRGACTRERTALMSE